MKIKVKKILNKNVLSETYPVTIDFHVLELSNMDAPDELKLRRC